MRFLNIPGAEKSQKLSAAKKGGLYLVWQDAGWGTEVDDCKQQNHFSDALVEACVELIRDRWMPQPSPVWITCVPSLRSKALVPNFAWRLAEALDIPFSPAVIKTAETGRQITMMNSWQQSSNLDGAFHVDKKLIGSGAVLLIDDVVASGWSLTIIGALLRQAGTGPVLPLVLASASAAGD